MASGQSKKGGDDKTQKKAGDDKGKGKKDKESATSSTVSTKAATEKPLTSEEKTRLAAAVVAGTLGEGLDPKMRKHMEEVMRAEMARRREERERLRQEMLATTKARLPWDEKKAETQKQVTKPSVGASVYPIKMELTPEAKSGKAGAAAAEEDVWDDSSWRPVAAGQVGPSLEQKRKAWIEKSLKKAAGPGKPTKAAGATESERESKKEKAPAPTPQAAAQPMVVQIDQAALKEIHAHTFNQMLQNVLAEAMQKQQQQQGKGKAPPVKAVPKKRPEDMTPDELVELRKRDPKAWDVYSRDLTIVSFGISGKTNEDIEQGKKTKDAPRKSKVTFDGEVEVSRAPVGRDYQFNEKTARSTAQLKK